MELEKRERKKKTQQEGFKICNNSWKNYLIENRNKLEAGKSMISEALRIESALDFKMVGEIGVNMSV